MTPKVYAQVTRRKTRVTCRVVRGLTTGQGHLDSHNILGIKLGFSGKLSRHLRSVYWSHLASRRPYPSFHVNGPFTDGLHTLALPRFPASFPHRVHFYCQAKRRQRLLGPQFSTNWQGPRNVRCSPGITESLCSPSNMLALMEIKLLLNCSKKRTDGVKSWEHKRALDSSLNWVCCEPWPSLRPSDDFMPNDYRSPAFYIKVFSTVHKPSSTNSANCAPLWPRSQRK